MKPNQINTILLMLLVILTACSSGVQASETSLEGSTWVLTAYNQTAPLDNAQVTLSFEAGSVSGRAGCNSYSGSYQMDGAEISIGPLLQTEMACPEPEGIMDQERLYLEILGRAQSYDLEDGTLKIFSDTSETLEFESANTAASSTYSSTAEQPVLIAPTPTNEPQSTQPLPPAGFQEYADTSTGISLFIPEEWHISGIVDGVYAIFTSYPEDKYLGGGQRSPDDSKCDLNLHPDFTGDYQELIDQWKADPFANILSEEEVLLDSGQPATQIEIDNRGVSISMVTEINGRVVSLTCWGDQTSFNRIAATLHASE